MSRPAVPLRRLRAGDADALLAFELENRAFFAESISDRGDAYFADFQHGFEAQLEAQQTGAGAYHVRLDEGGSIIGRFNLTFERGHLAVLGYRVARSAGGSGVATAGVIEVCGLAATEYGVRIIRAAVSDGNAASQRVLEKAGFVAVGPADPAEVGGRSGIRFERSPGAGGECRQVAP